MVNYNLSFVIFSLLSANSALPNAIYYISMGSERSYLWN